MNKISNIAKNTSYFTLALILQKILSFTYFTILARNYIPEELGKYYTALSFTTIFSIFIDMGLANVLTREIAKVKDKSRQYLNAIIILKIPLACLSLIATIVVANNFNYSEITKNLIYLSSICMVLDSFTLIFFSVIRGHHNLKFESIASVIFQLITITFGLIILKLNFGLVWQMGALVIASIFNFLFSAYLIKFKWCLSLCPVYDKEIIKKIVLIVIPFAIYGILQRLFTYLDTVFLSLLAGDKYVGLYQIAFKIINALQFLPMAFSASLYPALASYWSSDRLQLSITFERAMNYLIIISLPISAGIIILADKIILLFSHNYIEGLLPLKINMIALVFIFLTFAAGSLLNSCDRQKDNTIIMAIGLLISIILNILLIPAYKAVGASITVVIVNLIIFVLSMNIVRKITAYNYRKIIFIFLKTLLSVVIMGVAAFYLKQYLNIFSVVAISGSVYLIVLYLLKGFRKADLLSIYQSFKKC
jgi:O-antigen/teichoic acid export membrane protein